MKCLTGQTLLVAGLLSAAVVVPFLPATHKRPDGLVLEARLTSSAAGRVQVYWESGYGFNEKDSASLPLKKSSEPLLYQLPLPAGPHRVLRFDPIDNGGTVTVEDARIVDAEDRTIRAIPPGQFKPLFEIQSLQEARGRLTVKVTAGTNDPQLLLQFDPPVRSRWSWDAAVEGWPLRAGAVFTGLVLALFLADRFARQWPRLRAAARHLAARPSRAIALAAAAAVAASCYPVVFLGQSEVSPNYGTVLLYDAFPTLPGSTGGRTVDNKGSDVGAIMWQQVPISMIQHRALLRDGELPWWNRYNSSGTPLIGQGQSMFGDPLHLLVIAGNGAAWAWDLKYLVAKWLFATGLGLLVLAAVRHLPAALIITLAGPFAGFFVYRVNHPAFFSLCYAPWPLYCWMRITHAQGRRNLAAWGGGLVIANLALMNSGTAKEAYVLLLVMNLSGAALVLTAAAPWRERLGKLAAMFWAGLLFALATAPLWATFAETLQAAHTTYDTVSAYQIQPALLLGAFDEVFYRPLTDQLRVFNPSANFLILAGLLYFAATLRRHFADRAVIALAAVSLVPLSFAFGLVPAVWIVRVPLLANIAHIDNCFTCALIVLWSVLAGSGFAAAARRLGTPEGRDDLTVSALLLAALVFGWVAFRQAVHRSVFGPGLTFSPLAPGQNLPVPPFIWGDLVVLLAATVALGCLARRCLRRRTVTPAAFLAFVLCGFLLLWREGEQAGAAGFEDYVVHPPARVAFHAKSEAVSWVQARQQAEPCRSIGLENNLFPGWTASYGLEGINGPDALMNPFYRDLTLASPLHNFWDWRLYLAPDNLAASRPFLDFLNVRYYFDLHDDPSVLGRTLQLDRKADLNVYESPTAWPRAFFTDRLGRYRQPAEFLQMVLQDGGRPFAAATPEEIRASSGLAALPQGLSGRTVVPADHYRLTESSTSFDLVAPGPGLAIVTETFWPNYSRVLVDGRGAQAIRLNHAFEGVAIESAGRHRITFYYRPPRLTLLASLSAAGLMGFAGTGWFAWRRGRAAPAAGSAR